MTEFRRILVDGVARTVLGRLENEVVSGELAIPVQFGAQPSDSEAVQSVALGSDFRRPGPATG